MNPVVPTTRIGPGGADALDQVMSIMEASFEPRFGEAWSRSQCQGIMPMGGVRLMLARDDGDRVIGFSLSRTVADEAELLLLAVTPEAQGAGHGGALLAAFADAAKAQGARSLLLEVRDGNPAVRLYRRHGFAQVGRRRDYYRGTDGSRHDALTLRLKCE